MRKESLAITGASGYLASHLINSFKHLEDFSTIKLISRNNKNRFIEQGAKFEFIEKDLKDCKIQTDTIIHTAYLKNLEQELEFIKSLNSQSYFVFFSSAAVYGEMQEEALSTKSKLKPISDYGRYKLKLEEFIQNHFDRFLILRISNPYGKEFENKGVYKIFKNIIQQGSSPVQISINSENKNEIIRDMIHIDKFCQQVRALIESKSSGIFNISSGIGVSLEELALQIAKEEEKQIEFNYLGFKDGDIRKSVLEPSLQGAEGDAAIQFNNN